MSEAKNLRAQLDLALKNLSDGNPEKASAIYNQTLKQFADDPEALYYLGLLKQEAGDFIDSVNSFHKITKLHPLFSEAQFNIGNVLIAMGKGEEAIPYFEKALSINPNIAEAHYNLGIFSMEKRDFREAEKSFRKAIALKPDWAEAYTNLGNVLSERRDLPGALQCYFSALKYKPEWLDINTNIGGLLLERGELAEATVYFQKGAENKSDDYIKRYSIPLLLMQFRENLSQENWKKELLSLAEFFSKYSAFKDYKLQVHEKKKLKIGYFSPDFCKHSCSWFIIPLFLAHNRHRVEVNCFSITDAEDYVTEKIKRVADKWFDMKGLTDLEASELILDKKIDLLVDLAGHTSKNRLGIFAYKPAPVQVTWLGFPGSTGLTAMDYRLSDSYLTPEDTPEYFSEKIWNLDRISHCYKPPEDAPEVGPSPFLKNGFITFGSFNVPAKISNTTLELWAGVMGQVRASRLIIKVKNGNDPVFRERLYNFFSKKGIVNGRIDILSFQPTTSAHLDYYNQVDIALDTFPYNGATTTLEALWMGVPVITLAGDRTASRYGLSFLNALNLSELAARSEEEYIQSALKLANQPEYLTELRAGLRRTFSKSPLYDWKGFAREVEAAYREMWSQWCRSQKAENPPEEKNG